MKSYDTSNGLKNIITVMTSIENDTIRLSLGNIYPDVKNSQFNGVREMNGYNVAFMGSRISNYELTKDSIPEAIRWANKVRWPLYVDYRN